VPPSYALPPAYTNDKVSTKYNVCHVCHACDVFNTMLLSATTATATLPPCTLYPIIYTTPYHMHCTHRHLATLTLLPTLPHSSVSSFRPSFLPSFRPSFAPSFLLPSSASSCSVVSTWSAAT
jgi:hypothetical protein